MVHFKHTPFKIIFLFYFVASLFFAFLYTLPFSHQGDLSFTDAFFLSVSSISVTGLSSVSIADSLTPAGTTLLLIQLQMGGIGVMAIFGSLLVLLHTNLSLSQQTLMAFDQNLNGIKSVKQLMIFIFTFAFVVEAVCFGIYYLILTNLGIEHAFHKSLFHSVAAFTNGGMDLFGDSMMSYAQNELFVLVTSFEILMGVIGFPVVLELLYIRKKKFSLFTKVNLSVHSLLLLLGFGLFFFTEYNKTFQSFSFSDKLLNAWFLSVTSRNGGLTTIDIGDVSNATLLLVMCLMFIGASASSCGGGIRTTTFAVLIARLVTYVKGRTDVVLFKTTIHEDDVRKSFVIFMSYVSLFLCSAFLISLLETLEFHDLLFEVMSALTTTGLSTGITASLSTPSKILLCFLMLIGRIGIFAFIYTFIKPKKRVVKYPTEHIIVG